MKPIENQKKKVAFNLDKSDSLHDSRESSQQEISKGKPINIKDEQVTERPLETKKEAKKPDPPKASPLKIEAKPI